MAPHDWSGLYRFMMGERIEKTGGKCVCVCVCVCVWGEGRRKKDWVWYVWGWVERRQIKTFLLKLFGLHKHASIVIIDDNHNSCSVGDRNR